MPSQHGRKGFTIRKHEVGTLMYLNLKQSTYEQLLNNAKSLNLPLATLINQILEKKITQQGVTHGRINQRDRRKQTK